jgi:hypothetical protein
MRAAKCLIDRAVQESSETALQRLLNYGLVVRVPGFDEERLVSSAFASRYTLPSGQVFSPPFVTTSLFFVYSSVSLRFLCCIILPSSKCHQVARPWLLQNGSLNLPFINQLRFELCSIHAHCFRVLLITAAELCFSVTWCVGLESLRKPFAKQCIPFSILRHAFSSSNTLYGFCKPD